TRFMPSDLEVRGRGVDQDCMAGPGTEKFLIDDADPAPDVEKRRASANVWPEHLEKHCRGAIGPLALVPIPVAFGLAMIEDRGEMWHSARISGMGRRSTVRSMPSRGRSSTRVGFGYAGAATHGRGLTR